MSYYNVCEHCGSNLDPGEKCDCMEQQEGKETVTNCNQLKMKEKKPHGCANTHRANTGQAS